MNLITCKETGKIYTVKQLSKKLGRSVGTVREHIRRGVWVVDSKTYRLVDQCGVYTNDYNANRTIPVINLTTGKIYRSLRAYGKQNGVSHKVARRWAEKQYKIRFLTESEMDEIQYVPYSHLAPKSVIDVVSGKVWASARACAREIGVTDKTVARYIRLKEELNRCYLEYLDVYNEQYTEEEKAYLKGLKR